MPSLKKYFIISTIFFLSFSFVLQAQEIITADYMTLRGEPLYKNGFKHFDYANPNAPKGGQLTLYTLGTYDNFNRFSMRGDYSEGYKYYSDTLMTSSDDETNTLYPLIASKVEYPADYKYIIFYINPLAKDNEGQPITGEDVAFSFNTFYEKGVPQFRSFYEGVTVKVISTNKVRFDLNRAVCEKEMLMSLAESYVLPKRFWQDKDFSEPLFTPPLGVGPYNVFDYKMGQYVVLSRNKDYWAKDLPVNKGRYNFDTIRFDYYLDSNVALEAFKAGEYDIRTETNLSLWATSYTGKLFDNGTIKREVIENELAQVTRGFVFNTDRPLFLDRRIRLALTYFLDFQWLNKNLFFNENKRTRSYFSNTQYEAKGLPSKEELAVLEPFKAELLPQTFISEYNPAIYEGNGDIRAGAREAIRLLGDAGWTLKNGKLIDSTGKQMEFELLLADPSTERYAIPFQNNLKKYGITMNIRLVDGSQMQSRYVKRDFDMIASGYHELQYPSSNVLFFWNTKFLDSSYNTAGVKSAAVDSITEQIAAAQEDDGKLLYLAHALDRVLTWNAYIIPLWYTNQFRIAYKDKFGKPKRRPKYALGLDSWWVK